jgi:hypothetical protein
MVTSSLKHRTTRAWGRRRPDPVSRELLEAPPNVAAHEWSGPGHRNKANLHVRCLLEIVLGRLLFGIILATASVPMPLPLLWQAPHPSPSSLCRSPLLCCYKYPSARTARPAHSHAHLMVSQARQEPPLPRSPCHGRHPCPSSATPRSNSQHC